MRGNEFKATRVEIFLMVDLLIIFMLMALACLTTLFVGYVIVHWLAILGWGGRCPKCDNDSKFLVCVRHLRLVIPHMRCGNKKCGRMMPSSGFIMMPHKKFDLETREIVTVWERSNFCGRCNKAVNGANQEV